MAALRAVKEGEKPARTKKQTVAEAAASGDQRATLVAMRDRIAKAVADEKTLPRDLAALTKRLDDIIKQIAALDANEDPIEDEGDVDDTFDASAI